MTEDTGADRQSEISLDHTKLLGFCLLPESYLEREEGERHSIHLKMGASKGGGGNKFFGGNAGIRRVS